MEGGRDNLGCFLAWANAQSFIYSNSSSHALVFSFHLSARKPYILGATSESVLQTIFAFAYKKIELFFFFLLVLRYVYMTSVLQTKPVSVLIFTAKMGNLITNKAIIAVIRLQWILLWILWFSPISMLYVNSVKKILPNTSLTIS